MIQHILLFCLFITQLISNEKLMLVCILALELQLMDIIKIYSFVLCMAVLL